MRHPTRRGFWLWLAGLGLLALAARAEAFWTEAEAEVLLARYPQRWESLVGQLDLERAELASVRRAIEQDRASAALVALLKHFRHRTPPGSTWLPPFTAEAEAQEQANAILDDRFQIQGTTGLQPRREDGGLDWEAQGPANDPEWAWMLNRHTWFEPLLLAYQQTGDTRYVDRIATDLSDWVVTHPYPARLTFSASWRPLEVARRILNSWTHVFFALQEEPAFSAEARFLLLSSLPKHADSLAHHYSFWGGNHLLTETTALATIAAAWPEFKDAKTWRDQATERFQEQLLAQTYPDGAFMELTNHYQRVVWLGAERFLAILAASEEGDFGQLEERTHAMRRYFEGVMRPDGLGPLNNASDRENNAWFLRNAGIALEEPVTELADGSSSPSLYFPWAGHAVMRDRWDDGSEWAFFDIGPYGSAHQHRDSLHLSVWFHGYTFLADSGRYTYQPGPWTGYFKGPEAHNVILIDGQAPLPGPRVVSQPLNNTVQIEADGALFSGQATYAPSVGRGDGIATHTRTVWYQAGWGWLIADELAVTGTRSIEAIWNFGPAISSEMADRHLRLLAAHDGRGPIPFTQNDYHGETHPVRGWYSEQFGQIEPALQRHFTFQSRSRTRLLWAVPVAADAQIQITPESRHRFFVDLERGGEPTRLLLHFTPDGLVVESMDADG